MKDALGHGSNNRGLAVATHAAAIHALPPKATSMGTAGMSDQMWRNTMPIANYTSQVQDMLAMWDGTHVHSPLSAGETQKINDAYAQRGNWREVAKSLQDRRRLKVVK